MTRFALLTVLFVLPAAGAPLTEDFLNVSGARIFYQDSGGSGIPIVFLHAATGTVAAWQKQVATITDAGFRFIAFDRRGWGRSTTGPQPGTASGDLIALLDHLNIQKCHLLGTAAGGFVAIDFALSFPDRLRGLVIANSIGGVEDDAFVALGKRLRPPQFDALPAEFRELGPAFRAADAPGTALWSELEKHSRPEGPRAAAQPMKNKLSLAALETIRVPTLLLTGGADLYAPPAVEQILADHIRNSRLTIIPDSGHSSYWEQPEAFNRLVLAFLRQH